MKNRTTWVRDIVSGGQWIGNGGRRLLCACGLAVVASLGGTASADPIQLLPTQTLSDGAAVLLPGRPGQGFSLPCVADWNRDGKKDLLVGFQPDSRIALYLNLGTDAQPCFTNFTVLKTADGTLIEHPSGGCGSPAAWVCDFDADGNQDLLVGDGANGKVWFYRNTNSTPNATPALAPKVALRVGTTDLSVGMRATPCVHDWNGDGLSNLLSGDMEGYVWFFSNTNTAQAPIFTTGAKIQAGGANLYLAGSLGGGGRSIARVMDWDGDGLKDLMCSSDGGVYWCRNTNGNSNPILEAPVSLYAPTTTTNVLVPIVNGGRMRIDLVDWNDDGVMDLMLGNTYGGVYYYEGYRFGLTRIAPQSGGQIVLQWNSAPHLRYNVLTSGCPTNCQELAATNVPSGGTTTSWTNQVQGGARFFRVQIAH